MGTENDNDHIKSVLKFITGESEHICRLCMDATPSTAISLEDSKEIVRPYFEGVVYYADMLLELGVSTYTHDRCKVNKNFQCIHTMYLSGSSILFQVTEEPSMPFILCAMCADLVTEAYLFQRLAQYSNKKWEEVLNKINSTLDLSYEARPNVRTMYFIMGVSENCLFTSRLSSSSITQQAVLTKVKNCFMQRERNNKLKTEKMTESATEFMCQNCGERFESQLGLSRHMQTHLKKKYPCSECAKLFKTIWSLNDHKERLHSAKNIKCPKCPKMVSTARLLQLHNDRDHTAAVCNLCFIQFPSKTALNLHMNRHGQNKCMVCEKQFINKQSFQVHIKSCGNLQVKQRLYCDICNQSYNRKNALRTHLKIKHGFGKNIFSCKWCDKKFDAVSRLKYHVVKHTKEKNFHCEKCGGMFVTQAALVYHIRLHTGEKPFKCDLCPETFLSASRRMEHKKRKHFGPQKKCPFCASKFITRHSLMTHVARHKNPHSKLFLGENLEDNNVPKKKTFKIVQIVGCEK